MGSVEEMAVIPAERVFAEILLGLHERGRDEFEVDGRELVGALSDALVKFPRYMGGFDEPYFAKLLGCFYDFLEMGFLSKPVAGGNRYKLVDPELLGCAFSADAGIAEVANYICDRI